jgi:hypothetical protein
VVPQVRGGSLMAAVSASSSGGVSSKLSSLTTSHSQSSAFVSGDSSGNSSASKKFKVSPPKVFVCPLCPKILNEKDFSRHVLSWFDRFDNTEETQYDCPGITDGSHPLLRHFPHGSLRDRVHLLVKDIRSLVHPGAYDSLTPEGSGRHVPVAARFAFLLQ